MQRPCRLKMPLYSRPVPDIAAAPGSPVSPAVLVRPMSSAEFEKMLRKAEFAQKGRYFFSVVQGMKDQGRWKPRRKFSNMNGFSEIDSEVEDIWD